MPTAGKVFVSHEFTTLTDIPTALEGFRKEELYKEGEGTLGKVKD
jgi:hypothetical protein